MTPQVPGLHWVEDPSHGWLAVPLAEYPDALESGTGHGYLDERERVAYLEEDCEAVDFLDRHPELAPALDADAWPTFYEATEARIRRLPNIPRRMTFAQFIERRAQFHARERDAERAR